MTDWFPNIATYGLPWWAVLSLLLFIGACREGIPAVLKYRGFGFDWQKYQDGVKREERDALVTALETRINELAAEVADIKRESRDDRLAAAKMLADEKAAHAKCQLDMAELRGDMRVMQEKVKRLEKHEEANKANVESLQKVVEAIPPQQP